MKRFTRKIKQSVSVPVKIIKGREFYYCPYNGLPCRCQPECRRLGRDTVVSKKGECWNAVEGY